jgi:serine/threonine-protein kinase RsbW/sigma-B regulation protein RsbU (phosphoserine phosphatase)
MGPSASGAALELDVINDVAELPHVVDAIDALCATGTVSEAAAFAVKVALDEVLMNVIHHGHTDGGRHHVHIRLEADAERVRLEVSDDGRPFDPLAAPPPDTGAPLPERPVGGLGIHLVRQLMDEVTYQRAGDRNVLVMTKRAER